MIQSRIKLLFMAVFLNFYLFNITDAAKNVKWEQIWESDFSRAKLNPFNQLWKVDEEPEDQCRDDLQKSELDCHRKDNVKISQSGLSPDDQSLIIIANKFPDTNIQNINKKQFISGKLTSIRGWKHGKVIVSARLPRGNLLRPEIFMIPVRVKERMVKGKQEDERDWFEKGRIDVMVAKLNGEKNTKFTAGIHYSEKQTIIPESISSLNIYRNKTIQYNTNQDLNSNYHEYGIEWNNQEIIWTFDDKNYYTTKLEKQMPFDQQFHIVLHLGVAGKQSSDSSISQETDWLNPQFAIKYVRVFNGASSAIYTNLSIYIPIICLINFIITI